MMSSLFKFETLGIPNLRFRLLNFFSSLRELRSLIFKALVSITEQMGCNPAVTNWSSVTDVLIHKIVGSCDDQKPFGSTHNSTSPP